MYPDFDLENEYQQIENSYNEYYNYNYNLNLNYENYHHCFNNGLEKKTQTNTNEVKTCQIQKNDEYNQSENSDKEIKEININIEDSKEINNKNKNKNKSDKKKCGRKRKMPDSDDQIEHNKFSDDNLRRKCKHLVLKYSFKYINDQIKEKYNGNIGIGIFEKELKTIKQSQKSDATIKFNQFFLNKNLGDIFSEDISGRYTNLPSNHNKVIIHTLLNEKDENKNQYFNKLFNITFKQCLRHFINQESINELEGMKCFNEIKNDLLEKFPQDGEEYIDSLDIYLKNFEELINNKKSRKSKKNNDLK